MNIIEIIKSYAELLSSKGRAEAHNFLEDIGCNSSVREAIAAAFPDDGMFCTVDGLPTPFSEVRFDLDLGNREEEEGGAMTVNVTNEGIIFDVHPYNGDDSCSWGMTFNEWYEKVLGE